MMIHEITEQVGRHKRRKRVGRGESSGLGKTSGRGSKGAGSRSGNRYRASYEGGQIPFARRLPKRGFSNADFRNLFHVVNLKALEARCENGAVVDIDALVRLGLVRDASRALKVLGEGELTKKLSVTAARFSASAKSKIEAAGGSATVVEKKKWTRAAGGEGASKKGATA
ncbi:MAG: 50S ribosomal protein L15 [Phycisphaerales bacterium]|nr:50S ribosomal protein L15 [Phycisphaerales bacterium]